MDSNQKFWLTLWALAAVVVICGFHGCRKAIEICTLQDREMADRGYEYVSRGWIRRQ